MHSPRSHISLLGQQPSPQQDSPGPQQGFVLDAEQQEPPTSQHPTGEFLQQTVPVLQQVVPPQVWASCGQHSVVPQQLAVDGQHTSGQQRWPAAQQWVASQIGPPGPAEQVVCLATSTCRGKEFNGANTEAIGDIAEMFW